MRQMAEQQSAQNAKRRKIHSDKANNDHARRKLEPKPTNLTLHEELASKNLESDEIKGRGSHRRGGEDEAILRLLSNKTR